jgi:hypothetical protein
MARAYNIKRNTRKDFFDRIIPQANGCYEFKSYADRDGYKFFQYQGKEWKAHRLAVVFDGRDLPKGQVVMHHCDNPGCVNPQHLSVATQKENMQDWTNKGFNKGNIWPTRKGYTKKHILENT